MKNKLTSFFIIFIIILIIIPSLNHINAQSPTSFFGISVPNTPGVTCGNADDLVNNTNICCQNSKQDGIENTVNKIVPNFGCILGLCISDIPKASIKVIANISFVKKIFETSEKMTNQCVNGNPDYSSGKCICIPAKLSSQVLCERYLSGTKEKPDCDDCAKRGIWTGLGCIETDPKGFIMNSLLSIGIGLAGGIALLCIIFAAFRLQSSAGNPEKIKKAQELLTSCITGLILIIFSVLILRLIGADILRIPSFR